MLSVVSRYLDPFKQRRKQQEIWNCLRRMMDEKSALNLYANSLRNYSRTPICRPVLLQPYTESKDADIDAIFAITRDLSDEGISIITRQPLECPEIVCAFWQDGPIFMLGDIRFCHSLGGGFWIVGLRFTDLVPIAQFPNLRTFACQLAPEVA
jgi:PilZ domain